MKVKDLRIPVNPDYNWELTPDAQSGDYANPVELNNKLIEYANAHIAAASHVVGRQRARAELKLQLKEAEQRHERLRRDILRQFPPPPADRKSNLLLEAYIERMAFEHGLMEDLTATAQKVAALEAEMERLDALIEAGKQVMFLIKDLVVGIQTHLSYRKHEFTLQGR